MDKLDKMNNFSSEIEKYYISTRPYQEEIREKEKLCKYIKECGRYLQQKCEKEMYSSKNDGWYGRNEFLENMRKSMVRKDEWDIFTFGSESWGTSCRDSDIDMAIFVNFKNTRPDKKYLLFELARIIGENDNDGLLIIKPLLNAKYPIIRITQNIPFKMKIDVSIADRFCKRRDEQILNIINDFETKYNIPIKKLIVFIKYWSKQKGINNAYQCYLNSFGYTLFVIKFIQYYLTLNNNTNLSLSHLVYKFFQFYAKKWKPETDAISIHNNNYHRNKSIFDAKQFNQEINGYCYMEINDPINIQSNVAQRIGFYQSQRIKQEFINGYDIISNHNDDDGNDDDGKQSIFQLLVENNQNNNYSNSNYMNYGGITQQQYLQQFQDQQQDQNYRDGLLNNYTSKNNKNEETESPSSENEITSNQSTTTVSEKEEIIDDQTNINDEEIIDEIAEELSDVITNDSIHTLHDNIHTDQHQYVYDYNDVYYDDNHYNNNRNQRSYDEYQHYHYHHHNDSNIPYHKSPFRPNTNNRKRQKTQSNNYYNQRRKYKYNQRYGRV